MTGLKKFFYYMIIHCQVFNYHQSFILFKHAYKKPTVEFYKNSFSYNDNDHLLVISRQTRTSCVLCPRGVVSPQAKPSSSPHILGLWVSPVSPAVTLTLPFTRWNRWEAGAVESGLGGAGTQMSLQILIGACLNMDTIFINQTYHFKAFI